MWVLIKASHHAHQTFLDLVINELDVSEAVSDLLKISSERLKMTHDDTSHHIHTWVFLNFTFTVRKYNWSTSWRSWGIDLQCDITSRSVWLKLHTIIHISDQHKWFQKTHLHTQRRQEKLMNESENRDAFSLKPIHRLSGISSTKHSTDLSPTCRRAEGHQ